MGFKRVMKNIQKLMGNNELIRHEGGTFGNWTHTLDASEPIAPGRDTVTPGTRVYVVRLVGLCEHFSKNRDRGNWGEGVKGGDGLGPALTSVILSPRLSVSRMCKGLEEEGRGGSGCLQCCKRLRRPETYSWRGTETRWYVGNRTLTEGYQLSGERHRMQSSLTDGAVSTERPGVGQVTTCKSEMPRG